MRKKCEKMKKNIQNMCVYLYLHFNIKLIVLKNKFNLKTFIFLFVFLLTGRLLFFIKFIHLLYDSENEMKNKKRTL